jgi:hypothetical protein
MSTLYLDYACEDLPTYEKRRRPERCSQMGPVRRGVMRARSQSKSTAAPSYRSTGGGFHRRIIKKPFYGLG